MAHHDHLIRAIARDANLRVVGAVTTHLVADGAQRHGLSPAATCAVGRALTSGLLLATLTKGGERVTVQLVGDGPIGSITVDATDAGDVRGYALHPDAGPALTTSRGRVAETLGRHGVVNVLRDLGLKELYQGQVSLVTGEVDEDVEAYLRSSEQVPSALGCEVLLDADGRVQAAGGILVQALPDGDPGSVREIQHALRTGRLFELLASGERSARALAQQIYGGGEALEVVGDERAVRFQCRCSAERIGDMLALLTTVDLDEMIADDKPAEVICNFCNTTYRVERPELERIRSQIAGGPRQSN
jgi:molecular chaperone Hsp33